MSRPMSGLARAARERISAGRIFFHGIPFVLTLCFRPFTLLAGTAIVLILVALWSISLLSNIGSDELPSTLLATSVNHKRD